MCTVYSTKDVRGLRIFHDTVETHYRGLCALDINENTYSSIAVPTLLEKIPNPVRLTITRGEDLDNKRFVEGAAHRSRIERGL